MPAAEAQKAAVPMKRPDVTQARLPAAAAKEVLSVAVRVAMQARQRAEPRERQAPVVAPGAQLVLVVRRVLLALLALVEPSPVRWALSC